MEVSGCKVQLVWRYTWVLPVLTKLAVARVTESAWLQVGDMLLYNFSWPTVGFLSQWITDSLEIDSQIYMPQERSRFLYILRCCLITFLF